MALSLIEAAAEAPQSNGERETIRMFAQLSPILGRIPMKKIDGRAHVYNRDATLPGIGWRGINQAWAESTGTLNPYVERLQIFGGEIKIDNFLLETQPAQAESLWATQVRLKTQAASNEFDRAFFEGDDLTDVNQMVGLRRRLSGNQVILQATGGGTLTLAALDQMMDAVPFPDRCLYMNRTVRRKVTALVNATGGSVRIEYKTVTTPGDPQGVGKQIAMYNGAEIYVVETMGDATTTLDYDEDPGDGTADTASIYCVSYGEELVTGIYNGKDGKVLKVQDFGELQAEPRHMGRLELFVGMAVEHPRAAARLRGITNT